MTDYKSDNCMSYMKQVKSSSKTSQFSCDRSNEELPYICRNNINQAFLSVVIFQAKEAD